MNLKSIFTSKKSHTANSRQHQAKNRANQIRKRPTLFENRIAKLLFSLFSLSFIVFGSYFAIQYARGNYRITPGEILPESGLLSANSFPTGAQVYIDDELATATNDTIYLKPGSYQIKISKGGYSPWKKTVEINKELVTETDARLFPAAPTLTPLTFTGVENILPSPDGRKIVYYTASASAEAKNGLYVLELSDSFAPFQKTSRQIAEDVPLYNLDQAQFIWSPDSSKLMILADLKQLLIDVNQKNNLLSLPDISFRRNQILSEWEQEIYIRERQYLAEFPEEIVQVATQAAKNVYMAPNKQKLLYTATASATIPENLVTTPPSTSTQPEARTLKPDKIYVYDRKEDKNFEIPVEVEDRTDIVKPLLADDLYSKQPRTLAATPSAFTRLQGSTIQEAALNFRAYHNSLIINTLQWLPNSKHLIYVKDEQIQVIEYDGTNNITLYSGPFADQFIYPWPDDSRIVINTSFSPDSPKNLYSIELK